MMPCGTRKNRRFEAPRGAWYRSLRIARKNSELEGKYPTERIAGYRLKVGDRFIYEGDIHTVSRVTNPKGRIKATITTNKGPTFSFRSRVSGVSRILEAESFSAEQKLKRDSCCCGATKANPCACMIQGVMQCDATCPCSLAKKGAESFEAPNHISESDLDDMLYSDEQGVWYKEIIYRVGDNQYKAMYFLYNEDLEYVGKSQFDISADTITVSNITIKDQYKRKNYATVLIKDVMEYWADEPRKLDFSDAVTEEGRAFIEGWEAESFSAEGGCVHHNYPMAGTPDLSFDNDGSVWYEIVCGNCGATAEGVFYPEEWGEEMYAWNDAESFSADDFEPIDWNKIDGCKYCGDSWCDSLDGTGLCPVKDSDQMDAESFSAPYPRKYGDYYNRCNYCDGDILEDQYQRETTYTRHYCVDSDRGKSTCGMDEEWEDTEESYAESFSAESCPSLEANNENHDWVVMRDYVMVEQPQSPFAPNVIVMAQIECMHCGKTYDTSKSWSVERRELMRAESFEAEECDHNWRIDDIDFTSGYGDPPEVEASATVTCENCGAAYQTSTSWYPDPVELVRDAESFDAEGICYKCGVSEKKQKLWWAGKKGLVCGICSEGGVKYRAEEEDSNLTKKEVKMNLWYPLTVGFLGGTISTIAANMISIKWAKKNGHL